MRLCMVEVAERRADVPSMELAECPDEPPKHIESGQDDTVVARASYPRRE